MKELLMQIGRDYLGVIAFVIALVLGVIVCWKMHRTLPTTTKMRYSWRLWVNLLAFVATCLTLALWLATYLLIGTLLLFANWLIGRF